MLKSEVRKIVVNHLDAVLKPLGWKHYKSEGDVIYTIETLNFKMKAYIGFYNLDHINFEDFEISIPQVEKFMSQLFGDEFISPILDIKITKGMFRCTITDVSYQNICIWTESEQECHEAAEKVLDYIFGNARTFIEKYLYLPNVLRRMNELMEIDCPWQNQDKGILCGRQDAYLRGLIISKLCNDPDFEDKLEFTERRIKAKLEFWKEMLPYYEKLKEILPTIEPIYSMDDPDEEQKLEEIRKSIKGFDRIEPVEEEKKPVAVEKKEPLTPPNLDDITEEKSVLGSIKSLFGNSRQSPLTVSNSEAILNRTIFDLAKQHGFEEAKRAGSVTYFTRNTPLGNAILPMINYEDGIVAFQAPSIRIDKAEEWMQKLYYPMKPGKFDCFGTVILPLPEDIQRLQESIRKSKSLEDFKQLCIKVWMFLEENLETFLSTYSTYQSVWEQLCRLEDNNEGWDNFLRGLTSSERILRGIILEKFCEDEETWEKFVLYEDAFNSYEELKDWRPAVEQLRNMLDDIKTEEA